MNFQQLRFVISVVDTGSFTRAADLCCVTQPALSNAINQLEDELGAKLLDRTTRSVSVTDFGALLIGRRRYGWRGSTAAGWTLIAMALLVLAFFGSTLVLELVLHRR